MIYYIIMASISDVYGNDFQARALLEKATYVAKLYAVNIVHKQFSFRNEGQSMWNGQTHSMKPEIIRALVEQVHASNPHFSLVHVSKGSPEINAFPYFINGDVEYFVVVDMSGKHTQLYSVYITPTMMEAF